jgi:hypothetical protein
MALSRSACCQHELHAGIWQLLQISSPSACLQASVRLTSSALQSISSKGPSFCSTFRLHSGVFKRKSRSTALP